MIEKYRKYDYKNELESEDIWQIFNLDLEYGKFQLQKRQMIGFLQKIAEIEPKNKIYIEDVNKVKDLKALLNYSPLISYFKQFYYEELQRFPDEKLKKMPFKLDQIAVLKK